MIHFHGIITEFYPYRTKRVLPNIVINTTEQDERSLKRFLFNSGYQMDNHIAFVIDNKQYVWYSDHKLLIGTEFTSY